uniref:hypothetical protein n=1 Tax=Flavobacterium filum TaxID=370974 RepID=UPI0023F27050
GDRRNLYYCIFTSRNLNDKKELYSQLKEVKSFNSLKIDEKSNNLLAWSYHKDYNMDAQNTLVDFLPEFLEVRVEEFLSVLMDLKNSYGSILNNFK